MRKDLTFGATKCFRVEGGTLNCSVQGCALVGEILLATLGAEHSYMKRALCSCMYHSRVICAIVNALILVFALTPVLLTYHITPTLAVVCGTALKFFVAIC